MTAPTPSGNHPTPPGDGRLGRDVVPAFHSIRLVLDARLPDYRGSSRTNLLVRSEAASFRFHARRVEITSLRLSGPSGPLDARYEPGPGDTVVVTPARPLPAGEYALDLEFRNAFNTQAASLYRLETGGEAYAFTQFESNDAREAFPCWDEPCFKQPWQMTLVVPEGHLAVTNTPVEGESVSGGQRTVIFARTKPMPSYLLAIATGPLEETPIPGMGVPGRVLTVKGQSRLAAPAVAVTPPILAALERYFGSPYPYEKLDLLGVPEFWPGAMENPGAVTFADRILLLDPRNVSAAQKRNLAAITAHELAHMWFGDLVTMEWWDDLWLNESFASWMGDKVTEECFPELRVGVTRARGPQGAMGVDAHLSTRTIRQPVTTGDNLLQSADALAYEKGQAVLAMFEAWIGPEAFRDGVRAYLAAHAWGNATAGDLWSALGKASGKDLPSAMATFLDQPGVPLVSVQPLSGNEIRLAQRRFLTLGVEPPGPQTWKVPVALRASDGPSARTHTVLLEAEEASVRLPGVERVEWIYPNAGEHGYYRWSLPAPDLAALAEIAPSGLLPEERVGMVGNLAALLDAGRMHGDVYLAALEKFSGDPVPEVIAAVIAGLQKVHSTFIGPELHAHFAPAVRRTLRPALERFGIERRPGEEEAVSMLRPGLLSILGDEGEDEAVLAHARRQAEAYLADPSSVDPAIGRVVLELRAHGGDSAWFDLMRRRFEEAPTPVLRSHFLMALASFRDPAAVGEALAYAQAGPLRPQEIEAIPREVASREEYADLVLDWILARYEWLIGRIPAVYSAYVPWYAAGRSLARLERAKAFFADPAHRPPGTEKELAKVEDVVRHRVRLAEAEGERVALWLRRHSN